MTLNKNIFSIAESMNNDELFKLFMKLERYVNDGSPSGFELGLPEEYNPLSKNKYIEIPLIYEDWTKHIQIGKLPPLLIKDTFQVPFLIHPYVAKNLPQFNQLQSSSSEFIHAQPTASGRTVLWSDNQNYNWFIKLHFPLKLGRFNRDLNLFHWISILERSRELFTFASSFPHKLGFFHDFGGTFYQSPNNNLNFGTIFRESIPRPRLDNLSLLIPSFSLFANSRIYNRKQSILADFLSHYRVDEDQFLSLFIYPLIDTYIYLINNLGMIPEFNAQNVLYEFDLKNKSNRIILRDTGDCFIDFDIRERENLHTSFCSYKTLDARKHKDVFQRRSFAFDFKLSYYILHPLLNEYSTLKQTSLKILYNKVKEYFKHNFPDYMTYFNSIKWYSYPNLEAVNRSSYIENDNPLFR